MAADMICAYYDRTADSRKLFEKTKLSTSAEENGSASVQWDKYLNKFNVIRIVMTDFIRIGWSISKSLQRLQMRILNELSNAYPNVRYDEDDFVYSMDCFYHGSGIPFVIVIDEWDAIFRIRKEDKDGQTLYLNFLRDWLKDREYVVLAYMTGILPIKKYGEHSALNMFSEYSMIAPMQLARFTGFTEMKFLLSARNTGVISTK